MTSIAKLVRNLVRIVLAVERKHSAEESAYVTGLRDVWDPTARLDRRMVAEGELIDRILGLPHGSVVFSNPNEYRLMLRAIAGD